MTGLARRRSEEIGAPVNRRSGPRHFLDLKDFDPATLRQMLDVASGFKRAGGVTSRPLAGKTLALIFEKPSTRTRVSFEVGMRQLGGDVVMLSGKETQLGRGETIADTARVLSRYVDAIMLRTDKAEKLHELAEYATVPVVVPVLTQATPNSGTQGQANVSVTITGQFTVPPYIRSNFAA